MDEERERKGCTNAFDVEGLAKEDGLDFFEMLRQP